MAYCFLNVIKNEQQEVSEYIWQKTMAYLASLSPSNPKSAKQIGFAVGCMDIVINKILCSQQGQTFVAAGVVSRPAGKGRSPAWVNNRQGLPFAEDSAFLIRKPIPDSITAPHLRIQWQESVERYASQLERVRVTGSSLQDDLDLYTSDLHRQLDGAQNEINASSIKDQTITDLTGRIEHIEKTHDRLLEHYTVA